LERNIPHKETIMNGHDRHNTTMLSIIHNMSTACSKNGDLYEIIDVT